jgi:CheY-like chemotaxis protein
LAEDEQLSMEAGMDAFLTKPIDPEKLKIIINKYSRKKKL